MVVTDTPANRTVFRVLLNLGLKSVGAEYSQEAIDEELAFIDTFYGEHVSTLSARPVRS